MRGVDIMGVMPVPTTALFKVLAASPIAPPGMREAIVRRFESGRYRMLFDALSLLRRNAAAAIFHAPHLFVDIHAARPSRAAAWARRWLSPDDGGWDFDLSLLSPRKACLPARDAYRRAPRRYMGVVLLCHLMFYQQHLSRSLTGRVSETISAHSRAAFRP